MSRTKALSSAWVIAWALWGVACTGDEVASVAQLVDLVDADVAACPAGGVTVRVGNDANGDGTLQPGEVKTTKNVCSGVAGTDGQDGTDGTNGTDGQDGTNGTDGQDGVAGTNALISTTNEAPGSHCATGGLRVDVGLDDDRDGTLDASEIDGTSYVCNGRDGVDGLAMLIDTSTDTLGQCGANGGVRWATGVDTDRDATLDASEIAEQRVLCNGTDGVDGVDGADGTDGLDGDRGLIDVSVEPAGATCPIGGQRIATGLDVDRDGILDAAEVTSLDYVCTPLPGLTLVTTVAPGTPCAHGGTRIEAGLDGNANGALEPSEVTSTSFACNGADGTNGANGTNGLATLVTSTAEGVGANCPNGGRRFDLGADANGNGTLDAAEITSTSYACNGQNGADGTGGSAVRLANEPIGSTACPDGGVRIQTGPDSNGNGALDDAEVVTTAYSCNGAGLTSLVAASDEPAGASCAAGGTRIDVGIDTNRNGTLDASEVTQTSFVCDGAATVPFAITTADVPAGGLGSPYSATLSALGGTGGSYTWSIVSGALPAGLSLAAAGTPSTTISGTPLATGSFDFTVRVTDYFGQSATRAYTVTVSRGFEVTTFAPPRLTQNVAYGYQLQATGGQGALTWSLAGGALPAGLTLSSTGLISGTPTGFIGRTFVARVVDGVGATAYVGLTIGGEQPTLSYYGDFNTDAVTELGVARLSSWAPVSTVPVNGPLISTGDVISSSADLAPGGRWLAYRADADVDAQNELFAVDLSGPTPGTPIRINGTLPASSSIDSFKWSPDGRWLAFYGDVDVLNDLELYVVDMSGPTPGTPIQVNGALGTGGDVRSLYEFSPDSRYLAYIADFSTATGDLDDLYVADLSAPSPISTKVNSAFASGTTTVGDVGTTKLRFSNDGRFIFYVASHRVADANEVNVVDISGPAPGPVMFVANQPASFTDVLSSDWEVSPDGRRIFYVADETVDGLDMLYVRDLDASGPVGTEARRVSPETTNANNDVVEAYWHPDGRRLAFVGDPLVDAETQLFIVDTSILVGGSSVIVNPPMVTGGDVGGASFTAADVQWSPSGEYVYYIADQDVDAEEELFAVATGAVGASIQLNMALGASSDVNSFAVSPDGQKIAFHADPVVASVDGLYVTSPSADTFTTPLMVNVPLTTALMDVVSGSYQWVGMGEALIYRSDEALGDQDEAWIAPFDGRAPLPPARVNVLMAPNTLLDISFVNVAP
ncbi:putative Ig domain-containing protein [Myxococcota bacterium]|nr:putative Ig domain-containing protein [Myxococcota bacterium]